MITQKKLAIKARLCFIQSLLAIMKKCLVFVSILLQTRWDPETMTNLDAQKQILASIDTVLGVLIPDKALYLLLPTI